MQTEEEQTTVETGPAAQIDMLRIAILCCMNSGGAWTPYGKLLERLARRGYTDREPIVATLKTLCEADADNPASPALESRRSERGGREFRIANANDFNVDFVQGVLRMVYTTLADNPGIVTQEDWEWFLGKLAGWQAEAGEEGALAMGQAAQAFRVSAEISAEIDGRIPPKERPAPKPENEALYPPLHRTPEEQRTARMDEAIARLSNAFAKVEATEKDWEFDSTTEIAWVKSRYFQPRKNEWKENIHRFTYNTQTGQLDCDCESRVYHPETPCIHLIGREREIARRLRFQKQL
jgi:hypothetical protein